MTDQPKPVAPVDPLHEEDLCAIERRMAHCREVGSTTAPILLHQLERLVAELRERRGKAEPPVYPEVVDFPDAAGQVVHHPTPSVLLEIAPSGFAERIAYGEQRGLHNRLVRYVLAPPEKTT